MAFNDEIDNLLNKKMTRKGFVRSTLLGLIALTGLGTVIRMMAQEEASGPGSPEKTSPDIAKSPRSDVSPTPVASPTPQPSPAQTSSPARPTSPRPRAADPNYGDGAYGGENDGK